MFNKALSLSIVIPVYNEENYLKACLDSIANQIEKPDEVIVVDNNSTDKTVQIASSYSFVKLLHEKKQHQSFAQIKGVDNARSDIIARIDADTILHADWVQNAKKHFSAHPGAIAITGPADFYDVPLKAAAQSLFHSYHFVLASKIAGHGMLWGANCAFRKSSWQEIKADLLKRSDIWEDYDLSFLLARYGQINYCEEIKAGCSLRAAHKEVKQLYTYQIRGIRTFKIRTSKLRSGLFLLCWSTMAIFVPIAVIDHLILKYMKFINSPRFTLPYYIARQAREELISS
jgi:cellulose synthase/poly-beta-1,6-N-acetylglucosamine synthase-like glycosyltransferase